MMELKEMDEKQKPRSTSVSCYEQKARCIKASRQSSIHLDLFLYNVSQAGGQMTVSHFIAA